MTDMCVKLQNKVYVPLFCQNFGTATGVSTVVIPPVTLIFKEQVVAQLDMELPTFII